MVVSSLIFGLLHATNILSGQPILTVALTVVFAFTFGICMYLTLRVTGNLIWPMLIHGLYDPTVFLATGGIDQVHAGSQSVALSLAGPANFVFIVIGILGLIFVPGRARRPSNPAA
jgi:membrane protease YdiL (CAAX protease family)